jgi:hypothetical protein
LAAERVMHFAASESIYRGRGKTLDRLSSDYEYNGQAIDQLLKELE